MQNPAEISAAASKDEAILILLAQLAIVYWRPDFTPGQARQLYAQYLEDLRPYALADIIGAITAYRRNKDEKFYPLPGQLRGLIEAVPSWDVISKAKHIGERLQASKVEMAKIVQKVSGALQIDHTPEQTREAAMGQDDLLERALATKMRIA